MNIHGAAELARCYRPPEPNDFYADQNYTEPRLPFPSGAAVYWPKGFLYQPVEKVTQHLVGRIILGAALMPDHYMTWGMSGPLTLSTGCYSTPPASAAAPSGGRNTAA